MSSRFILNYLKQAYSFTHSKKLLQISMNKGHDGCIIKTMRYCSTYSCYKDKDPGPLFFSEEVQSVLKKLTGFDFQKIFKDKHLEDPDLKETDALMTHENMDEDNSMAIEMANVFLKMPPVLQERKPIKEVLSYDPEIQGLNTGNIIFTDITVGLSNRNRLIVVREPSGVLRKANWDERDRMNQIYNPTPGCSFTMPKLFENDEYLSDAFRRKDYLFVLDFACAQFEPDDPKYQEVAQKTYDHVLKHKNFDILHSTRHFGPMCFYFAWNKKIEGLLGYFIQNGRLEESVDFIRLYHMINDNSKLSALDKDEAKINVIKNFIKEEKLGTLELIIQNYEEAIREKEEYAKKLKSSHGIL